MAVADAPRDGWTSRRAFLLAAIGSAVGLGNLWRFSTEAGTNGGSAFVLFYIFCVILIGLPVLLAETLIGRHGQSSAPESVRKLAAESNASKHWGLIATLGVIGSLLILSFYCVVGGWVLYFIWVFLGDIIQTGLAGGAFMLHWSPKDKKIDAYDGRETAPAGATPDMFLDDNGKPLGIVSAVLSGRSVGAPGVVSLLAMAQKQHGKLPWARLDRKSVV